MKKQHHPSRLRCRRGASLIDVAIGSMLMATLLIPSMNLINESRANSNRLDIRQELLHHAEQTIESTKLTLSEDSAFASAMSRPTDQLVRISSRYGSFALARVQVSADTSVRPAELVTISVDVWQDDDNNRRLDANELSASLRTQWAAP
ncbi:hypothetical protein Pla22_04520 [Rubripirellula amarantea]|uniref:Uncharacterized protein n=1 Tax=Rubripirellula amarantea TaxID=2527999 RepID=A0A5C5WPN8_9BACT|nr:hypothetical protein [Rubripirellula amarantea]TWT52824.1 hypothetical protein Pla22_04520 [Rubripirellula amarantea]